MYRPAESRTYATNSIKKKVRLLSGEINSKYMISYVYIYIIFIMHFFTSCDFFLQFFYTKHNYKKKESKVVVDLYLKKFLH